MREQFTDAGIAAAASKSTYTGSGLMITGWLFSSEAAILVGMIVGVLGLAVNIYFKIKQDRREEKEHKERMKDLKK
jgi:Tfp pilus assembly protein PilO